MRATVRSAEFVTGAHNLSQLPEISVPEVAFIGRSNVGKSTLLNHLSGRKQLAHTSKTPGKTTELNLFSLSLGFDDTVQELAVIDLPGYGYAKTSKGKRERLSRLTVDYIVERPSLSLLCLLQDSKRKPEEEELQLRRLSYDAGVPVQIIVTKIDRLSQKDRHKNLQMIARGYGLEKEDLILSGTSIPAESIWERLIPFISPE